MGHDRAGTLSHFRLRNLAVHDVWGGPIDSKNSGLVFFMSGGGDNVFEDVVIDNVTAFNTNQWAGIKFNGSTWPEDVNNPKMSQDVTIRNSTVHNVYGDGILLTFVQNGLIEYSVAYDTGRQPVETVGSPGAIWTWACYDCTVQFNEAYRSNTPSVDGSCFDIDWFTRDNVYQYNYGHDSVGHCISVFGAGHMTTVNSVVRYNICANNARDAALATRQGTIFLSTWDGGSLDGVQIYNNTIYYNPATDSPVVKNQAVFVGSNPNFFKNNLIISRVPTMVESNDSLEFDHNLYWHPGTTQPVWEYGGVSYEGFEAYQTGTGQDLHGMNSDPLLRNPEYHQIGRPKYAFTLSDDSPARNAGETLPNNGTQDFFGNPIPYGDRFDIGAHEWSGQIEHREHQMFFAQFGEGQGRVSSELTVLNLNSASTADIKVLLRDSEGEPLTIDLNGEVVAGELTALIPPLGKRSFQTDGVGPLIDGSATVYSDRPVSGVVLFGGTSGLAGVGSSLPLSSGFLAPMETHVDEGIGTGVAVMSLETKNVLLDLLLRDGDGKPLAQAEEELPKLGQLALMLDQFDWTPRVNLSDFQGLLEVKSSGQVAATVILVRPDQFATMPVAPIVE
jgi:hypothetical protein